MRGPLVTRRVKVPVVAAVLMLAVGWMVAAPVSAEEQGATGLPSQRTTTTVAPPETTTTVTPETTAPAVPTVANESTQTVETKGEIDDPAQKQLRWIIIGLVGLAVVILILTIWFWRATRPARRAPAEAAPGDAAASDGITTMDEAMATDRPAAALPVGAASGAGSTATDSVRIATRGTAVPPGHRAPIWADEHLSAGTARPPTKAPDADR